MSLCLSCLSFLLLFEDGHKHTHREKERECVCVSEEERVCVRVCCSKVEREREIVSCFRAREMERHKSITSAVDQWRTHITPWTP